ncbi:hypothetical protein HKCCE2091_16645 [Rhodobacterales bacterium HKCCE2091]|nr:hypothetical protein [Rhodobacterales bacterium HKCCE2091]
MGDDTGISKPIETTIVDSVTAGMLVTCAHNGAVTIDGTTACSSAILLESFAPDRYTVWPPEQNPQDADDAAQGVLIIMNQFPDPLTLHSNSFAGGEHTGGQTDHPSGTTGGKRWRDRIPARGNGDMMAAGIGIYRFRGRVDIFHSHTISGALSFDCASFDSRIAVGFRVPGNRTDPACVAVSANLVAAYGDTDAFYDAKIDDKHRTKASDTSGGVALHASITTRTGVWVGERGENLNQVVTLVVLPA